MCGREFAVNISDVYELQSTLASVVPVESIVESVVDMRPCSSCECPLPASAFSKTQLGKGTKRRCTECVQVQVAGASACKRARVQ